MRTLEEIDQAIGQGYHHSFQNESTLACQRWLEAWNEIKTIMVLKGITELSELEKLHNWNEFMFNFIQDFEIELHNAGLEDANYFRIRQDVCRELIALVQNEHLELVEQLYESIEESKEFLAKTLN